MAGERPSILASSSIYSAAITVATLLIMTTLLSHLATPSFAAEATDAHIQLATVVPDAIEEYEVYDENGSLFVSWSAPIGGESAAFTGSATLQSILKVYPGWLDGSFTVTGTATVNDSELKLSLRGSGGGGAINSGEAARFEATGFLSSGDSLVSITATFIIDRTSFKAVIELEPDTPSSLPLFAVASSIVSQTLKNLADRLEASGFTVEVSEDRGLTRYHGELMAESSGEPDLDVLQGLLGAASPAAPVILASSLTSPSLLVEEPLFTLKITAIVQGGEEPRINFSGIVSSTVSYFSNAAFDPETRTASVTLNGSSLLIDGLNSSLCSVGLAKCDNSDAEPVPLKGVYKAVEAAFTNNVIVADNEFIEFTGFTRALEDFTIVIGSYKVVLPRGSEATLLGVNSGKPEIYGDFNEVIVKSNSPFTVLGPGYTLESEEADGEYTAILIGPGSFILASPDTATLEKTKPVTITVTTTLTETTTVTIENTVTTTTTVTLTLREVATTESTTNTATLAAIAGATIVVAAPIIVYLVLVRGRS